MKYPHTFSHKSIARLEDEIKLQHGTQDPIDRFYVWKASRRKKGEYMNEEARYVGERIVTCMWNFFFIGTYIIGSWQMNICICLDL